jgi:hypothetical protein
VLLFSGLALLLLLLLLLLCGPFAALLEFARLTSQLEYEAAQTQV